MLKHFGGFVVGVFVGVLIIAVALVGGGYMLLTKEGAMKKVEETVGSSVGMDLNEEMENLSILDYGKGVLSIFGNLSTTPIKDIEATVGINKISTTISDAIGIDAGTIAESSLSNLGATLTDNLTMDVMSSKFEIELPDLPLFQDEEFLAKPISEAFGDLDQNTLDSFIEVVYKEEATEENPASSALIQKLGKKTIKEVSENMDGIIQESTIGEVIDIDENSTGVLVYLQDKQIGELDGAIKGMKLSDAIEIHEADDPENGIKKSSKVMIFLKDCTLDSSDAENSIDAKIQAMTIGDAVEIGEDSSKVLQYLKGKKLDELDGAIKGMKLSDAIEIHEEDDPENGIKKSHAIMVKIANFTLDDLADKEKLQTAIDDLTLGQVVTIGDDSSKLLKSLADTKVSGLSQAMQDLTLEQVMDKHDVGVLSLVPPTTKVQDIGTELGDAVTETSLYALNMAGLFSYDPSENYTQHELVSRIYKNNSTPQEIINDFTNTGVAEKDKKSIAATLFLAEGANATAEEFTNTFGVANVAYHIGFKGALSIDAIPGIQKEGNAYILTPAVIDEIFRVTGLSERHDVILCVDDGIELIVQAPETEGVYDNYNKVFSIMYAEGQGSITFGKGLSMKTSFGGCAVYVASNINVYNKNTDSYDVYNADSTLPISIPFELRTASKEVEKEVDGVKTKVIETNGNTWISAYTKYQPIVTP
ncbi:MAG: hypothetical protein IJY07_01895 [Clostridia bacterium]|nr:hypothetical protein [Clostridia bacterium]